MPLGLYISVPFCRTKCSYCNFASEVFSRALFQNYVDHVCGAIENAQRTAEAMGARFDTRVDSIYFGGGTPTLLDIAQLERIFVTISQNFEILPTAEVTVECAPGTLTPALTENLARWGVNRVSLGVQSFVDAEAAAVGRQHSRSIVLEDIERLRVSGIENVNIDLIAGLPHQTSESWKRSLDEVIATHVRHVSVYMLEVDEDSRLGRELIAGGTKYHAHFVPDEDLIADFYETACGTLEEAGIHQYEISNFTRAGFESSHNLKYWTRQPYWGFGVDAHSMLRSADPAFEAVRFSAADSLERYMQAGEVSKSFISAHSALEEEFFLGLRLNRGVSVLALKEKFGKAEVEDFSEVIEQSVADGSIESHGNTIRLTPRGRLLSNEVFARFISVRSETATPLPGD